MVFFKNFILYNLEGIYLNVLLIYTIFQKKEPSFFFRNTVYKGYFLILDIASYSCHHRPK